MDYWYMGSIFFFYSPPSLGRQSDITLPARHTRTPDAVLEWTLELFAFDGYCGYDASAIFYLVKRGSR
jgi:hypothetical protein